MNQNGGRGVGGQKSLNRKIPDNDLEKKAKFYLLFWRFFSFAPVFGGLLTWAWNLVPKFQLERSSGPSLCLILFFFHFLLVNFFRYKCDQLKF